MDRALILKILGKKDSVDLDDSIYNLRDIGNELRDVIVLNLSINDDFIIRSRRRLKSIQDIIRPLSTKLKDDNYIKGYTNSKKYLIKYIDDLCDNIGGILASIETFNIKDLTHYTNMLMDLILIY